MTLAQASNICKFQTGRFFTVLFCSVSGCCSLILRRGRHLILRCKSRVGLWKEKKVSRCKLHEDSKHQSTAGSPWLCKSPLCRRHHLSPSPHLPDEAFFIITSHKWDVLPVCTSCFAFICIIDNRTHSLVSQHTNTGRERWFVHPLSSADMTGNLYPTSENNNKKKNN